MMLVNRFTGEIGFGEMLGTIELRIVDVCDAQPRYMEIGGYELALENESKKTPVAKREEGEKR